MKSLVFVLAVCTAYATAAPGKTLSIDLYKNTLQESNLRVFGGVEAERNQFPLACSLEWGILDSYSHICGCVAIKKQWVITAAHCEIPCIGSYRVVLGQLDRGEEHQDIQIHEVDKFVAHHNYPGGVAPFDLALLKLKTSIEVSPAVSLATLPSEEQCNDSSAMTILTGWGVHNILPFPSKRLRYAIVPRIDFEACKDALISLIGESGPLDPTMICTGSLEGTKQSACSGDSGGSIVLETDQNCAVGVVSWGISPCGTKGAPTVYTNICAHREYIDLITK